MTITEDIERIICKSDSNNTNLRFSKIYQILEDEGTTTTNCIDIFGGLNGRGEWENYFSTLSKLIENLKAIFDKVWVIKLTNDCADDVFCLTLGVL